MTEHQIRLLLVGGYPKGFDIPFHPDTLSGKRLRKIVESNHLNVEYLDIFKNRLAEENGLIHEDAWDKLLEWRSLHYPIIALGKWVHRVIYEAGIESIYLPHPASRSKTKLFELSEGLQKISKEGNL